MRQPTLFDRRGQRKAVDSEQVVLYALGDFQARGKALAGRELPLDRLRGALRRATEAYGIEELRDEAAVAAFRSLGAEVREVPPFVAKHPYRVTVPGHLAERAESAYRETLAAAKES